ncbi:hypothetical protein JM658_10885 [Joostella atrarenae]|uniref:Uncharacterized protein n=1 Tax=Joostella atrarenae TaxID=679257 RepID=A0ABS9J4S5_9FLAO|nr:hypothetical protein [Joostella atrarenae]MCF8715333.1 hypothetical protein [Joostella atrarenae]
MAGNILKTGKVITKTAEKMTLNANNGDLILNAAKSVKYSAKKDIIYDSYVAPEAQQREELLVTKVTCDVTEVEIGKTYTFKAVQFSRKPKDKKELEKVKWAYQLDDEGIKDFPKQGRVVGSTVVKEVTISDEVWDNNKVKVYAYLQKATDDVSAVCVVKLTEVIRLIITNEKTGYSIQGLKGLDYTFSDPVVVVPTYKTEIVKAKVDFKNNIKHSEVIDSFSVTRDAWYNLGKTKDEKYKLLNRAFVPADYSSNLYSVFWIPSYPNPMHISSKLDAFIFTRFGERKIPAQPLSTQFNIDGTPIDGARADENFATDIMIHVGGVYEVGGYDHVGGSYGCFAYTPKDDIYGTPELAELASKNDDYDDKVSNKDWEDVANKIKTLSFLAKIKLQIELKERDENKNYFPPKVLSD